MSRLILAGALLALAATARARATGPVTKPCGSNGAHPTVGVAGRLPTIVRVAASTKCFAAGLNWEVPESTAAGEVAIRDVRVEGDGIYILSGPPHVELLLEGVVVMTSTADSAVDVGTTQSKLTIRGSTIEMTGHRGCAVTLPLYAIALHLVSSTVTVKSASVAPCHPTFAIRNLPGDSVVVLHNATVKVDSRGCGSGETVGIEGGSVSIQNSLVAVMASDNVSAVRLRARRAPPVGWLVVEGSQLTAASTAAGATVMGVEAVGMRLASSTITVNGITGNVTAARVVPSGAAALPVTVQASTLSATAAGGEATGLHWSGDLATRLDLGAGTKVTGPVIVEGDMTGGIVMNGATVTAAAGPALDVRGAVDGTLEFGVTAAASLVTPTMPPLNVMRFAEPCSVTFGAFPADVESLEALLNRAVGVCNVTVPEPVPETDAKQPVSSAAAVALT